MKLLEDIKWRIFLFRLKGLENNLFKQKKLLHLRFCRYGLHKVVSRSVTYSGSDIRKKHIRYIQCQFCNYMFFAKQTDKDAYVKYKKEHDQRGITAMAALLESSSSSVKPKQYNVVGEDLGKGASVSVKTKEEIK